jgi:pre-mRNA-processing factor 40
MNPLKAPTVENRNQEPNYSEMSNYELKEAYKRLLKQKGYMTFYSQDQAIQHTRDEPVSKLLKMSEKKQCYHSLLQEINNEEAEEKKKKEKRQEADFLNLLFECPKITEDTSFREVMILIATDPRYLGVPERERERLFFEFLTLRKLRLKEEARIKKKEDSEKFLQYLRDTEVSARSTWQSIFDKGKESTLFKELGNYQCLCLFIEYVTKLEDEDLEAEKKEQRDRDRKSRKARDNWRELLDDYRRDAKITSQTKWKQFRPLIKDDDRYIAMLGDVDGSTPAEIFYDTVSDLKDREEDNDSKERKSDKRKRDQRSSSRSRSDEYDDDRERNRDRDRDRDRYRDRESGNKRRKDNY